MPLDSSALPIRGPIARCAVGALGILVIGFVDYLSGVELRVFPLYYLPLAALAWWFGRAGAAVATLLCGASWMASNMLAGRQYSVSGTWVVNTAMQTASFATVGLLIAVVRASLQREREMSRSDSLTSLLNRKGFYEEARRLVALCRRSGRPLTVAYMDLDNLKEINDGLGHEVGDEVLVTAAAKIRAATRPSDVAARLGGDEFVLLFPELGGAEAMVTLERIRSSLAWEPTTESVPVSASIGAVTFAVPPEDVEDMIRAGDAQMYTAKAAGRDRVELLVVADRGAGGDPALERASPRAQDPSL